MPGTPHWSTLTGAQTVLARIAPPTEGSGLTESSALPNGRAVGSITRGSGPEKARDTTQVLKTLAGKGVSGLVLACTMASKTRPYADRKFVAMLHQQVRHEFTAHQQYVALAVWFDSRDLPQLAKHFYAQSLEERQHALMMVKYLLDRDVPVQIPGVDAVRNEFSEPKELIQLALDQEHRVTEQVEALFTVARDENDAMGEQFILWFLKEQVEEVAAMSTLLTVANRAGDQLFQIEDFLARETVGDAGLDPLAPAVAGQPR